LRTGRTVLFALASFLYAQPTWAQDLEPAPLTPTEAAVLTGPDPLIDLDVPDHGAAVVSLPLGSTGPRPVVVATHGNYDTPQWRCLDWREVVGDRAFVLCPRGVRSNTAEGETQRWRYRRNSRLEAEIDAGLAALSARFPGRVDTTAMVYTGLSQGAIMGVPILSRNAERFPYAVLIEGGNTGWSERQARAFRDGGGQRVLLACGGGRCNRRAEAAAELLGRQGVEARVFFASDAGHSFHVDRRAELLPVFEWLVENDPRWSPSAVPAVE
jgi:dienelactone hydrolase